MMDQTSKTLTIAVLMTLSYMASSLIAAPFMGLSWGEMMLNFSEPRSKVVNMLLVVESLILGGIISRLIKTESCPPDGSPITKPQSFVPGLLTPDERKVADEIRRSGEITQDSLRFRFEWSKAKVSAILTQLERHNVIQRSRLGKTYTLFLSKEYSYAAYGSRGGQVNDAENATRNGSGRSDKQVSYPFSLSTLLARLRRRRHQ